MTEREVLVLREHEQMPYAEIGLVMGVTERTAAELTWRARAALAGSDEPAAVAAVSNAYRERLGVVRAPVAGAAALARARAALGT